METRVHIPGLRNLSFHSGAASNELPDLGQATVLFQVAGSSIIQMDTEEL